MAAIILGSAPLAWTTGTDNPGAIGVTIPVGTKLAVWFFAYFASAAGNASADATLDGASPILLHETLTAPTNRSATGLAIWRDPTPGSVNIDTAWDAVPTEGPTSAIAFIGGSAWPPRDWDSAANESGTANSVTLDTRIGDLVLMFDQHFNTGETIPSTPAGFTSLETIGALDEGARLSYRYADAVTQACTSQDPQYSTVAAVAISAGAAIRGVRPQDLVNNHDEDEGRFNDVDIRNWFRTAGGVLCPA